MASFPERRTLVRNTAIVFAIVCVVWFVAWRAGLLSLGDRQRLLAAIDRARALPYLAPLFVGAFAVGAATGVPATPLTLAGGVLFGAPLGIALNWLGELLAALLAFAAVRATGFARRRHSSSVEHAAHAFASARRARTLFRLRLVPVMPFALLNVGAAISGMAWSDFVVATALGIVPITVIYTVSASALVTGVAGSGTRAFATSAASAAVLIAISFLPRALRATRRGRP